MINLRMSENHDLVYEHNNDNWHAKHLMHKLMSGNISNEEMDDLERILKQDPDEIGVKGEKIFLTLWTLALITVMVLMFNSY